MSDFVFLHGGKQGSWVWQETLGALERQAVGDAVRTFALDVPGCGGKRGRDTSRLTLEDVVDELARDIDAAGLQDVVLVGHSLAGTVLPRLIQARRPLFRRVVYVSCSAPLTGQTVAAMMGTSRHGESPGQVGWPLDPARFSLDEQFRLMFCNDMSAAQAARFMRRLGEDEWPEKISSETDWRYDITENLPATFVLCLADGILPAPWQERFAQRFGVQRLVRIDAGHQVMNTRPHALAEVLRIEAEFA